MHFLTRLSYNSQGWQRPTGEAAKLEHAESFNVVHGFGFEDWLFRGEWQIDGWRYAFIQGVNRQGGKYHGVPLDLTLYTVLPDKRRRLIANLYEVESLDEGQAQQAVAQFRANGWLEQMEAEVLAVQGNPSAILHNDYTLNLLNVRYRSTNVDMFPPDTIYPTDKWLSDRHRYQLYQLDGLQREHVEGILRRLPGRQEPLNPAPIFRRGTAPVQYSPEHRRMQALLLAKLQAEYGADRVLIEVDGIDVLVQTDQEIRIYEIKSDLSPRTVMRNALGQILEYAYHPSRVHALPLRLIIVGRCELDADESTYLDRLKSTFRLPLEYLAVPL